MIRDLEKTSEVVSDVRDKYNRVRRAIRLVELMRTFLYYQCFNQAYTQGVGPIELGQLTKKSRGPRLV